MDQEQVKTAIEMNKSGVQWTVIASYFNVTMNQLRKERKEYDSNRN